MDNYIVYLISVINEVTIKKDITDLVSNLGWRDSIESLGKELSFDFARNLDDIYMKDLDIVNEGDFLLVDNNGVMVFSGIITDLDVSQYMKSITAFDYAFYLNKNETIIQFKNISADSAVKDICKRFNVDVSVPQMATRIKKIYKDQSVAAIISDVLKQVTDEVGDRYFYEMNGSKLNINLLGFETINPTYQPSQNVSPFPSVQAIGGYSLKKSIQNLKDSVIVTSSDEKSIRIIAEAKDEANIKKYGLLQEVVSVSDKDEAQASNIATNRLKLSNKIENEASIEVLGSDIIKCGRLIPINTLDLSGDYLIKESEHQVNNGIHKCQIVIRKWVQ